MAFDVITNDILHWFTQYYEAASIWMKTDQYTSFVSSRCIGAGTVAKNRQKLSFCIRLFGLKLWCLIATLRFQIVCGCCSFGKVRRSNHSSNVQTDKKDRPPFFQSCGSGFRIHWIQHFKWVWNRIRIQSGSRVLNFNDQKLKKKKYSWNFFFSFFWSKIVIYVCSSYRRSLQPSKENIHFWWAIFALLDPDRGTDPLTPLNPFFTQSYIVHNKKSQVLHCKYLGLFLF
jgi:hypothetical protein